VNELPKLPDDAGALKPRLLLLPFLNTFAGREDVTLKDRLKAESVGIANWSLEGLCRLREQGCFTIPSKPQSMIDAFERTVSPIRAFIDEKCALDPNGQIAKNTLYAAWCNWCNDRGVEPGSNQQFGTKLMNAVPNIKSVRLGSRNSQYTAYKGIRLP